MQRVFAVDVLECPSGSPSPHAERFFTERAGRIERTLGPLLEQTIAKPYRRLTRSPYAGERRLVVHGCYHKGGTRWFSRILSTIAREYGLNFQACEQDGLKPDAHIFFQHHSRIDFARLPPEYAGRSYQAHLNSLSQEEGLLAEIERSRPRVVAMSTWDYTNENVIEIKYEDLIADEQAGFRRVFEHYGFNDRAIERSLRIADFFSFKNQAKGADGQDPTKRHLRSGQAGQWKQLFNDRHKALFKKLNGDALVRLGYERDDAW